MQVYNYEKVGTPFRSGSQWFYYKNTGLQNQSVLYKLASPDDLSTGVPFIDLNAEFPDGTTSIRCSAPSEDGTLYAYGLSSGGTDWTVIKVRNVATGEVNVRRGVRQLL